MTEGEDYYIENGYKIFKEEYHLKRGFCCKNSCRHCPWKNKTKMKIKEFIFVDMDGVLCDFEGRVKDKTGIDEFHKDWEKIKEEMSNVPGFFDDLPPMKDAIESYNILCEKYEVYILSTPAWDSPSSYTEKRLWVDKYLGANAYKKLILSHNKGLMTGKALIDDRTKNGAAEFRGEHIHFGTKQFPDWNSVIKYLI